MEAATSVPVGCADLYGAEIIGLAVVYGPYSHAQKDLVRECLDCGHPISPAQEDAIEEAASTLPFRSRSFCEPSLQKLATGPSPVTVNEWFDAQAGYALQLQLEAALKALDDAGVDPKDVTHFLYSCQSRRPSPSLEVDLIVQLGLNSTVTRVISDHMGNLASPRLLALAASLVVSPSRPAVALVIDGDTLLASAVAGGLARAAAGEDPAGTDWAAVVDAILGGCDAAAAAVLGPRSRRGAAIELWAHAFTAAPLVGPNSNSSGSKPHASDLAAALTARLPPHGGPTAASPATLLVCGRPAGRAETALEAALITDSITDSSPWMPLASSPAATDALAAHGAPLGCGLLAALAAHHAARPAGAGPWALLIADDASAGSDALLLRFRDSAGSHARGTHAAGGGHAPLTAQEAAELGAWADPTVALSRLQKVLGEQLLMDNGWEGAPGQPLADLGADSFLLAAVLQSVPPSLRARAGLSQGAETHHPESLTLEMSAEAIASAVAARAAAALATDSAESESLSPVVSPIPPLAPPPGRALVLGLASAFPPDSSSYDQAAIGESLIDQRGMNEAQAEIVRGVFRGSGIARRGMSRPLSELFLVPETAEGMAEAAAAVASSQIDMMGRAARVALAEWGGDVASLTHVIYGDVSGCGRPAHLARLWGELGLPASTRVIIIDHVGCVGGYRCLALASQIAACVPGSRVLVMYGDAAAGACLALPPRLDLSDIVALAIFADGAASCVVGGVAEPGHEVVYEVVAQCSDLVAAGRGEMVIRNRFVTPGEEAECVTESVAPGVSDPVGGVAGSLSSAPEAGPPATTTPEYGILESGVAGLAAMRLVVGETVTPKVAVYVAKHVTDFSARLLGLESVMTPGLESVIPGLESLTPGDCALLVHPGGKSILLGVERRLGATRAQTAASWRVMEEHGNVAGATNLAVADLHRRDASDARPCLALSFGPGLSFEGLLLSRPRIDAAPLAQAPSAVEVTTPAAPPPEVFSPQREGSGAGGQSAAARAGGGMHAAFDFSAVGAITPVAEPAALGVPMDAMYHHHHRPRMVPVALYAALY